MRAVVAEHDNDHATIQSILIPMRGKLTRSNNDASHTTLGPKAMDVAILARIDSYLGRTEDALRESEDAVARATSVMGKPTQERIRAEVLMRAGQADRALDILEQIARVPYGPSYGELLTLRWERLHDQPRFRAIVEDLRRRLDGT